MRIAQAVGVVLIVTASAKGQYVASSGALGQFLSSHQAAIGDVESLFSFQPRGADRRLQMFAILSVTHSRQTSVRILSWNPKQRRLQETWTMKNVPPAFEVFDQNNFKLWESGDQTFVTMTGCAAHHCDDQGISGVLLYSALGGTSLTANVFRDEPHGVDCVEMADVPKRTITQAERDVLMQFIKQELVANDLRSSIKIVDCSETPSLRHR